MTKIIGHRGARGLAPENTLAAIRVALEYGVDEIEIDVRVTKDGVPVLNHNPWISSPNGKALVRTHSLAGLQAIKQDLPTLEEIIRFVKRRTPLLIEVKPRVNTAPIIKLLEGLLQEGWKSSDFLLGSFHQPTLRALHRALPEIEMVIIGAVSGVRSTWRARQLGTKRISLWQGGLWWGFLRSMQRHGYRICAYSLNDPAKSARWEKYGLYGTITDFPDRYNKKVR